MEYKLVIQYLNQIYNNLVKIIVTWLVSMKIRCKKGRFGVIPIVENSAHFSSYSSAVTIRRRKHYYVGLWSLWECCHLQLYGIVFKKNVYSLRFRAKN